MVHKIAQKSGSEGIGEEVGFSCCKFLAHSSKMAKTKQRRIQINSDWSIEKIWGSRQGNFLKTLGPHKDSKIINLNTKFCI